MLAYLTNLDTIEREKVKKRFSDSESVMIDIKHDTTLRYEQINVTLHLMF